MLIITFDHIGEVITVTTCHFTLHNIIYVLLDYIRASCSVLDMLVGSRGNLGCLMAQVLARCFEQ